MASSNAHALFFDGSNDYLTAPTVNFPVGDSPRTIEFWIKPEYTNNDLDGIFSYGDTSGGGWIDICMNISSQVGFLGFNVGGGHYIQSADRIFGSATYPYGQWYHLAFVYLGGGLQNTKIYVNGSEIPTKVVGNGAIKLSTPANTTMYLGKRYDGYVFKGCIDELRVWSVERLKIQIEDNRYKVLTGSESGLVGY